MINILLTILIITMILIAIEDFTSNEISVIWLIIFYIAVALSLYFFNTWDLINIIINIVILLIMYLALRVVFKFKNDDSNILDKKLGLGDVFIILGFTMVFSPINFLLFLNISFFAALLYYILMRRKNKFIPLAGIIAFIYVVLLLCSVLEGVDAMLFHNDFITII